MNRALVSLLLHFCDACVDAKTAADVFRLVEKVSLGLGFERFVMAELPLPHERLENHLLLNGWSGEWFAHYTARNYFRHDPVVQVVRQSHDVVRWSEAIDPAALSPRSRKVMRDAADHGLIDGITVPIYSHAGLVGLFSLAGSKVDRSSRYGDFLRFLALKAYLRLCELDPARDRAVRDVRITRRESECLALCVGGTTDEETAKLSHRSPRTIQTHLYNLQRKIGAANRAQLVAEAFRCGLLR